LVVITAGAATGVSAAGAVVGEAGVAAGPAGGTQPATIRPAPTNPVVFKKSRLDSLYVGVVAASCFFSSIVYSLLVFTGIRRLPVCTLLDGTEDPIWVGL
jgi:hypothetical protein